MCVGNMRGQTEEKEEIKKSKCAGRAFGVSTMRRKFFQEHPSSLVKH